MDLLRYSYVSECCRLRRLPPCLTLVYFLLPQRVCHQASTFHLATSEHTQINSTQQLSGKLVHFKEEFMTRPFSQPNNSFCTEQQQTNRRDAVQSISKVVLQLRLRTRIRRFRTYSPHQIRFIFSLSRKNKRQHKSVGNCDSFSFHLSFLSSFGTCWSVGGSVPLLHYVFVVHFSGIRGRLKIPRQEPPIFNLNYIFRFSYMFVFQFIMHRQSDWERTITYPLRDRMKKRALGLGMSTWEELQCRRRFNADVVRREMNS